MGRSVPISSSIGICYYYCCYLNFTYEETEAQGSRITQEVAKPDSHPGGLGPESELFYYSCRLSHTVPPQDKQGTSPRGKTEKKQNR